MEDNKNLEQENANAETKAEETIDYEAKFKELMIENAKIKKAMDKATSEASNFKKQLRDKQTEEENALQEKAEREAEREEQFKQLLRENSINKLEKSYLSMGYTTDEASRMAIAEADGDFEKRIKIMQEVDARKMKNYEAEWLKSRPNINVGVGATSEITKQQFNKMGYLKQLEFSEKYPELYAKFTQN